MARSGVAAFTDPQPYQAAVRPAQVEILVTAKGDFRAELTRVELPRLWMQRGRESLPRVVHATVSVERPPIFFLVDADQAALHHSGMDVSFGEIVAVGAGSTHHHRSWAPCHWASLSLTREDLAAAGHALVGRDLSVPSMTHRLRPALPLMSRLLNLHEAVGHLAGAAPHILAQPEPARALEQALVHVMIMCLTDGAPAEIGSGARRHTTILARFEELLAANHDRPLYLAEICAAIGASERTLRICCQEHLGMGPVRYLWLRRMHLARRALILATPETATVAAIAMDHGFWELGRFAGKYRTLFGESPSASLRRPPGDRQTSQGRPLALPDSETA
jgi:AraC-like DNA-binding protein